ncbi:hypothetical protein ACS212_23045, partial [Escherichia coli]|uniref:hypothetical protein n=1 Tax=Escherichia coli TaxID=562 RepID=UPI003F226F70
QVFLTYPFVDEAVGRDPQVARDLRMGDFTNLAIDLDLKLDDLIANPPGLPDECTRLEEIPDDIPLEQILDIEDLCRGATNAIQDCLQD